MSKTYPTDRARQRREGRSPLCLHKLDILDKHRSIILMGGGLDSVKFTAEDGRELPTPLTAVRDGADAERRRRIGAGRLP